VIEDLVPATASAVATRTDLARARLGRLAAGMVAR
jgi:hypothetical protein